MLHRIGQHRRLIYIVRSAHRGPQFLINKANTGWGFYRASEDFSMAMGVNRPATARPLWVALRSKGYLSNHYVVVIRRRSTASFDVMVPNLFRRRARHVLHDEKLSYQTAFFGKWEMDIGLICPKSTYSEALQPTVTFVNATWISSSVGAALQDRKQRLVCRVVRQPSAELEECQGDLAVRTLAD